MFSGSLKPRLIACLAIWSGLCALGVAKGEKSGEAAERMARYNVVWTSPSKDASGVMPIGNGDLGAGVYAIENGDLYLLLSKTDAFSYCGDLYKTGRLRISLTPNPFTKGKPFRQTLDLPTGSIQIEADGVKLRIWADANRAIYHVEIESPHELTVAAQPEFWKRYTQWKGLDPTPDVRLDRQDKLLWYFSVGDRSFYPEEMKKGYAIENPETIAPDHWRFNTFGNLVELNSGGGSQKAGVTDGKLTGAGKRFDVRIHALTMQTPDPGKAWAGAIEELADKPVDIQKDWVRHVDWWQRFWSRSWIIASDRTVPAEARERFNGEANAKGLREEADGAALVAQSYNMFRFLMGAQSRSRFQPKFNGGIFSQQLLYPPGRGADAQAIHKGAIRMADNSLMMPEDYRAWGRRFTFQNQRLLYWPLFMSGDFDLMKPFFDHQWLTLPMRKVITQMHYGHAGAFYRENINPIMGTEDWAPPPLIKAGEAYKGNHLMFHHNSGLETITMMADFVNFTGDTRFRDEILVPFARDVLLFFDLHYPRGADGKLRLEPSQALETWWITVNPAPDVAGLRFCLDQLLAMKVGTAEDQEKWKRFRAEIPEIPMQVIDGRPAIVGAEKHEEQRRNGELPEIYPVFPFRCYGLALGSKDLVEWTMQHRICKDTFGSRCWTQDQIGWALAGNAEKAAEGLVRRFRYATNVLRFPVYGNEVTDGLPDFDHFGSGAIALQRMLVQEGNGKIYLLPAWPSEWDVDFKLHLQGGVVLTGTVKDGKLVTWDIVPAARKSDVIVCTPASMQANAATSNKQAK